MTADDAMTMIQASGWEGFSIWGVGNVYMGCLIGKDLKPDYRTNLWDYERSPDDVLEQLARKADEIGPSSEK